MKTTILNLLIIIIFGSCGLIHNYTYIPLQPNTPAFTDKGEKKLVATTGISHSEFQGAVSPLKFIAFKGSLFTGYNGQWAYNYGASVYTPLFKINNTKIYTSLSLLRGEGNIMGTYEYTPVTGYRSVYNFDNYYTNNTGQITLYLANRSGDYEEKIGVSVYITQVDYRNLYRTFRYYYNSPTNPSTSINMEKQNIYAEGYGFQAFYHYGKWKNRVYAQIIGGIQPTSRFANQLNEDRDTRFKNSFTFNYQPSFSFAIGIKL